MEYIKNITITSEEYLKFILYNALETNCETIIYQILRQLNLLQIYKEIKSIFISNRSMLTKKDCIDILKKIFVYNDKICMQNMLVYACDYGHYETVKYFIKQGIDIHADSDGTKCALRGAEFAGHYNIVEYLIENGADIHVNNDELLSYAIEFNYMERIEYWISKGLDIHINEDENLLSAICDNNMEMVKFLVNNGADIHVDDDYPIIFAIEKKYFEITDYLIEKDYIKYNNTINAFFTNEYSDYSEENVYTDTLIINYIKSKCLIKI